MAIFFDDVQGDVAAIFLSYFQRAPEFEAMQHYVGVLEALQADPATADNAFNLLSAHIYADGVASQEVPAGPTVTDAWYVSYLYGNILGRAPDAEGHAYWTAQLASGAIERAELVATFIASALATEGRDAAYVENRTEVAVAFAQWDNSNPQVLPTLKYDAAEVLLGVNENETTVDDAMARLETSTGPVGETRNLTTGIDVFEGTTGNDTFNAVFEGEGSWNSTLTNFDTIDGDLGLDTLNIYVSDDEDAANARFPDTATVRNIEIVNVFNGLNSDNTLRDVSNYEGVEEFWQIGTAGSVKGVGEGVLVGFEDVESLLGFTVALQNGVAQASIALDNVGSDKLHPYLYVRGRDLTTVDVAGDIDEDADLSLFAMVGDGVRSLVINTEVDTELMVFASVGKDSQSIRVNTLDLSGSTGDVEFDINTEQATQLVGANAALNVTFGSGDDLIIFGARDLTLRDNIDGGEGYDTVALAQNGKLQTQNYDTIARLQNIDQLAFLGTNVEVDASELTDFDLVFAGYGDVVVSNLADDQVITMAESEYGLPFTLTLNGAAADVSIEVEDDVAFQLYVDATSAATKGATGGTLTLFGEGSVTYSNAASGKFSTIDATELEGVEVPYSLVAAYLGLEDDEGDDIDVGLLLVAASDDGPGFSAGMNGGVAETVALNGDTLDVIMVGVAVDAGVSNSSTYGKMDVIENFNSDSDAGPLDYLVGNGNLAKFTLGNNDNTLQLAFQAAAKAYDPSKADVLYFTFNGDTYLFADTLNGDSGQYDNADFALKIVGTHNLADQWVDVNELVV